MARTVEFKDLPRPAPPAARRSLITLLFGLLGAPAAWAVQEIVGYAMTAEACFPNDRPVPFPDPHIPWDRPGALAVNVLALVIAAAATWTAWSTWRREQGPSSHDGLERTRDQRVCFMALSGLIVGVDLLAAILFNTAALIGVPQCSG
jgi:hypothetical protein